MADKDKVTVYTDGACIGNPGRGGYGVVIHLDGSTIELAEGYRKTTNNRMEMLAAIVALRALPPDKTRKVVIHSDSRLLVDAINKGWLDGWKRNGWRKADRKPVLNKDLWQMLLPELEKRDVKLKWVKGHAGIPENERCDELANVAAESQNLKIDEAYEDVPGEELFIAAERPEENIISTEKGGGLKFEIIDSGGSEKLRISPDETAGVSIETNAANIDKIIDSLNKLR